MLTTLKVMPIPEMVVLPGFSRQIEEGVFKNTPDNDAALKLTVGELARWAGALKTLR